jgi:hypothetical protein
VADGDPLDDVVFDSTATADLGDASNICMACHQGRSSTPTVNDRIADGNLGFSNIHYFAAAATLFGTDVKGGYEYSGMTYRGRNTFDAPGAHAGVNKLTCIGCHLRGDKNDHDFMPQVADCTNGCHIGTSFENLRGIPGTNKTDIDALKNEVIALLEATGVTYLGRYPYFSGITTEAQLKAAYNWQLADKDPGGYIHNGAYIKQLLFDSITDMGGVPSIARP